MQRSIVATRRPGTGPWCACGPKLSVSERVKDNLDRVNLSGNAGTHLRIGAGRCCSSFDAQPGYQHTRAPSGWLSRRAALPRRQIGLGNRKRIDAENERGGKTVALLLDGAETQPIGVVEGREQIVGVDNRARDQAISIDGNIR